MDDEQKTPEQDETAQDEGAEAAGPVSDSGLPLPGESSESSPPAGEAPADEAAEVPAEEKADEAPAEEAADAAPEEGPAEEAAAPVAEEAPAAEPNPEDDLPWKERRRLAKSRRSHKARPALDVGACNDLLVARHKLVVNDHLVGFQQLTS